MHSRPKQSWQLVDPPFQKKPQGSSIARECRVPEILIGTSNPAKLRRIRDICRNLDLGLIAPDSLGLSISDVENSETPEGNARNKAQAWFKLAQRPVLSIDYALRIEGLAPEHQPGIFVRRIGSEHHKVTDVIALRYYSDLIFRLGGSASGEWIAGLALAYSETIIHSTTTVDAADFVAKPSQTVVEGEPLLSLQIDLTSGRYYSELSPRELCRVQATRSQAILRFLGQHLHIENELIAKYSDTKTIESHRERQ